MVFILLLLGFFGWGFFPLYQLMLLKRKGRLDSCLNVPLFLISLAVITTFSNTFAHYVYMSLDLRLTVSVCRSVLERACWDLSSLEACIFIERETSG